MRIVFDENVPDCIITALTDHGHLGLQPADVKITDVKSSPEIKLPNFNPFLMY